MKENRSPPGLIRRPSPTCTHYFFASATRRSTPADSRSNVPAKQRNHTPSIIDSLFGGDTLDQAGCRSVADSMASTLETRIPSRMAIASGDFPRSKSERTSLSLGVGVFLAGMVGGRGETAAAFHLFIRVEAIPRTGAFRTRFNGLRYLPKHEKQVDIFPCKTSATQVQSRANLTTHP